jgi:tetratricopeptide (TPR) repeat protein
VQRALGHSDHAEATLNVALAFLDSAVTEHDPSLPPRLAQRAAYLRAGQGRFTEALELIDEAVHSFEAQGRQRLLATALIDRAVILGDTGRKRLAVRALRDALGQHGRTMSRRTFLAAIHNTAVFLHEVARSNDETREALAWLRLAIRCHARLPATAERIKLRALLGLSAIRVGSIDDGLTELWCAHDAFKQLRFTRHQALTLLDLAQAALTHHLRGDLRRIAGEMFALLHAFGHDSEHRTLLLRFCHALQHDALTESIVARPAQAIRAPDP